MSGFPAVIWDGWEKYNALALTLTQRLWRGLTVNSNYTWSKALDDASNPGADNAEPNFPQDPANLAAEKGLSDFDHRQPFRHQFSLSDSVPEEFPRLDPHRVWRMAGGRNLDAAKRVALYGESLDGRRQQRRAPVRAIAAAEFDLQSEQRPENDGGMVQYVLLCDAGRVYLWQCGP